MTIGQVNSESGRVLIQSSGWVLSFFVGAVVSPMIQTYLTAKGLDGVLVRAERWLRDQSWFPAFVGTLLAIGVAAAFYLFIPGSHR